MKCLKSLSVLFLFVLLSTLHMYADPIINIYVGGGTATLNAVAGGQQITFASNHLDTFILDSAAGTPLTISSGAGSFLFTSVSGARGYFAPLNGANFSMGNSASGIASGSIDSIQFIGATTGATQTAFSVELRFSGVTFQNCTTPGCVNSATLMNLAKAGSGDAILSLYFQNAQASNLAQLLALTGTNASTMSGEFDATMTPEPASLALFGTGLLIFGMRLVRKRSE